VRVQAGIVPVESEKASKMVTRMAYWSFWDLWYRFRVFHLEFYDLETGKFLLKAGQYGDNRGSTEEKALDATFEQIREKLVSRR